MENTNTKQPETQTTLPEEVSKIIAIAKQVSEHCGPDQFEVVFNAIIQRCYP